MGLHSAGSEVHYLPFLPNETILMVESKRESRLRKSIKSEGIAIEISQDLGDIVRNTTYDLKAKGLKIRKRIFYTHKRLLSAEEFADRMNSFFSQSRDSFMDFLNSSDLNEKIKEEEEFRLKDEEAGYNFVSEGETLELIAKFRSISQSDANSS